MDSPNYNEQDVETVEAVEGFSHINVIGEFPLDIFPLELQSLIIEIATAYGLNIEPVACTMLAILSSAIGNTIHISPKEGWEEPPIHLEYFNRPFWFRENSFY